MAKAKTKRTVDSPQDKRMKLLRGFQFVVYAWALRLSFVAVGSVLVSVFQIIAPSKSVGIKLQYTPIFNWKSMVEDEYRVLQALTEPVLFTDVNVITPSLLRAKLARVTPILSTKLKRSSNKEYVHYASDRLWSTRYKEEMTYSYITLDKYLQSPPEEYQSYTLVDSLKSTRQGLSMATAEPGASRTTIQGDTCTDNVCAADLPTKENANYVYGTHSNAIQYLPALSPDLAQYLSLLDEAPQVCMWVSSPNVSAAMHYDLEDNLLLQISGTKRVVIVSPEALLALRPYTSLHPHWRQVSNSSQLYTSEQIISYLNAYVQKTAQAATASSEPTSPQSEHTQSKNSSYGEMKIYEVTLTPGTMVFIPAGYYHTITTGFDSLTVNAWFGSELSEIHNLLSNVPLPFHKTHSVQEKLNYFAVMLQTLLQRLSGRGLSAQLFAVTFAQRFETLLVLRSGSSVSTESQAMEWPVHDDSLLCSITDIQELDPALHENRAVTRAVEQLYEVFATRERLSSALVALSLMDYAEETLLLIWGKARITPKLLHDFARTCIDGQLS